MNGRLLCDAGFLAVEAARIQSAHGSRMIADSPINVRTLRVFSTRSRSNIDNTPINS
jgi:hypothetical protein